jgi:hypothetical protein
VKIGTRVESPRGAGKVVFWDWGDERNTLDGRKTETFVVVELDRGGRRLFNQRELRKVEKDAKSKKTTTPGP